MVRVWWRAPFTTTSLTPFQVLSTYHRMLEGGLCPDMYTFNALLTSMSRVGASLYAVQDLVGEMGKWGVKVSDAVAYEIRNSRECCLLAHPQSGPYNIACGHVAILPPPDQHPSGYLPHLRVQAVPRDGV